MDYKIKVIPMKVYEKIKQNFSVNLRKILGWFSDSVNFRKIVGDLNSIKYMKIQRHKYFSKLQNFVVFTLMVWCALSIWFWMDLELTNQIASFNLAIQ